MKILFAGTPLVAASTLEVLATDPRFAQFEVVAALTREDAPVGRKRTLTPSPVAETAGRLGIPVIKANRIDREIEAFIEQAGADLAIVIAFGVLLKASTLSLMPKGWFNLHFSILPRWRGAAPVQRAIMAGDSTTGVTLFQLDEGMDTGPIAGIVETEILPTETAGDLLARLRTLGDTLLAQTLPQIASETLRLVPQPVEGATLAPKLHRSGTLLDFAIDSRTLEMMVRGANPEPMAHTALDGNSIRILRANAHSATYTAQPIGTLFVDNRRVFVQCGSGSLELLEVQPAGKQPMDALAWTRGLSLPKKLGAE